METLLQKPSELVVGCSFFKEQQKFKDSWHAFNWKCYGKLNHSPQRCPWPNARNLSSIQSLSHIWLWDPMDCRMPGFFVHHQLLELAQTHAHRVGDAIQPSHPLPPPLPLALNLSQHQSLFQWVCSLHQVVKVVSVLPVNIQGWFQDWLVWSPCCPRDTQESSPAPQFKSISSSFLSLLYDIALTSIHD